MTAIEIAEPGGPEVLRPVRRPVPRPGPGEVLVRVAAAGVNRPDVQQRTGGYPPPPGASDIPGLEIAGEIVALGEGVGGWQAGQSCMALVAGGGYAEYCTAPAPQCLPIPRGLSPREAAAVPETFFTVWTNVFERGRFRAGERILIHGGASGIGTTAIQLAREFGAKGIFVTAGSDERVRACVELGASQGVNYHSVDFVAAAKEWSNGEGVDLILDMVGGSYFPRNLQLLRLEGRLVQIALLGGAQSEVNLQQIMVRRLTVTGSTLRPRSVAEKGTIADALRRHVLPLLDQGKVKPVMDSVFPLAEAAKAHARIEADHVGKIVLTC
ncbi:MAG: NAD(P)H-quinone oxidoreductase [Alphaproteobacteria bacterium]|nr:NAD(P)H-quinone oxidoreductase [Alphaproteobacteria bacterium]